MSKPAATIPWNYCARIWHRTNAAGRPLVIVRGPGAGVTVDYLVAMQDTALRLGEVEGLSAYDALGSGFAPEFAGPGVPLFDYLVRDVPQRIWSELSAPTLYFDQADLQRRWRKLLAAAERNRVLVVSKPWPLQPHAPHQPLSPDELALWQFDVATNFGQFPLADNDVLPGHWGLVTHCRCDVRVVPVASAKGADKPAKAARGGRKPVYDWDGCIRELLRLANTPDGLPPPDALRQHVETWFKDHGGKVPGDSTLRRELARWLPDFGA